MSLSDLNAIPLHDEPKAEETSPLKVAGENGAEMARPSSPDLKVIPGYQLDVPELNTDEDEEAMKAYEAAGGAAALMIEAFYGNITSDKIPQWIRDAVEAQANRLQQTPDGDFSKGMGGSLGRKSKKEEAEENQEKTAEWFENRMEAYEREQKKLEEWREKSIDVGNGVKMTGKEIDAVLELLGTKEGKQKFVDAFKKKTGANDDDANKAFNDYQRYLQLLKKRDGQDLTEEEKIFVKEYPTTDAGRVSTSLSKDMAEKKAEFGNTSAVDPSKVVFNEVSTSQANIEYDTKKTKFSSNGEANWGSIGNKSNTELANSDALLSPAINTTVELARSWENALAATEPLDQTKNVVAIAPPSPNIPIAKNDMSAFT